MDITLHQLRCFLAVADERHFARAAQTLRMAPSSLSHQISGLERELGRRLFERTSRAVTLTDDGRDLLPLARGAVSAVRSIETWAGESEPTLLKVGYTAASAGLRLILGAAIERLPRVTPRVVPVGLAGGVRAVVDRSVDCALSFELAPPDAHEGVAAVPLWEEELVVAMPEGHRLADRGRVRTDELYGETLIGIAAPDDSTAPGLPPWYEAIDPVLFERCRLERVATSADETMEVVAAGMGVNIAGASAISSYGRGGIVFVPLDSTHRVVARLVVRDEPAAPALRDFIALASDTIARADLPFGRG
ncbi:LysR family transcriptional regulator [Microbacterium suaedae]|uniref:LysR family transcriptional regulator n=1 Tax=Microbacterium suaedae TaxID=2067813 RepID=UPI0013A6526F|nr:LysR family transcriptional regulator [Microbacterium suaedae]